MMEASYEPVPGSWYAAIGLSMLGAAIYVVSFYPMQLPIWGLLLSLLVALVFLPACGIIAATTGTVIGKFPFQLGAFRTGRLTKVVFFRPERDHGVHSWLSVTWATHRKHCFQMLRLYGVSTAFTINYGYTV
jgi:hypothetical protein